MKISSDGTLAESSHGTPERANDGLFWTAAHRRRYGNVSAMTLHRWLGDLHLIFVDRIYIGNRRFWRLSDLEEFERRRVREKASPHRRPSPKLLNSRTGG